MIRKLLIASPLILFIGLAAIFAATLLWGEEKSKVPSALIGKLAPSFSLDKIEAIDTPLLTRESLKRNDNGVTVINVWASWCGPCRAEHDQIEQIGRLPGVTLSGINYKDDPEKAARFLDQLGNPFDAIGADKSGKAALYFGVYGVPETFIIDKDGIIQHRFAGAVTPDVWKKDVLPSILKLQTP